jgi:hypothetical protein
MRMQYRDDSACGNICGNVVEMAEKCSRKRKIHPEIWKRKQEAGRQPDI